MRIQKRTIASAALAAAACLILTLSGCSTTSSGVSASRHKYYESMADLTDESSRVIVGTVVGEETVVENGHTCTIATFEIVREFQPQSLGAELPEQARGPQQGQRPGKGETIAIRQLGTADMDETPAPLLAQGRTYLLFVTPTMMDGPAGSQYYVTGLDSGMYVVEDSSPGYQRATREVPDKLPDVITEADLAP